MDDIPGQARWKGGFRTLISQLEVDQVLFLAVVRVELTLYPITRIKVMCVREVGQLQRCKMQGT